MTDHKNNSYANVSQLVAVQAKLHPEKIAITHNGATITYHELNESADQLAAYFQSTGIAQNDIVAVVIDRSIKLVACLLGIARAGAAYLPIDPALPADRVNFMVDDSGTSVICTAAVYKDLCTSCDKKIIFDDVWIKKQSYSAKSPAIKYSKNDLAYVLYTSGSTGKPKGVAIEQGNLLNLLLSIQKQPGISHNDIVLGITTISFDIAELEIFLPLISGAQLLMVDNDVAKDGRALLEIIKTEEVSIVQATPFTWRMMLQSNWTKSLPIKAFCGGEAMTKDLAHRLAELCGEVWNMYGPTETTIYSTIKKISADDEVITIGWPIDNTRVYILNEDKQPVEKGQEGEIYIGGEGVARGYINRPEINAERFIENASINGRNEKLYKTGDLGKILPNGEIQYLSRLDQQVKIRGYRIETGEIEYQLKQRKGIRDAVIVMHEDEMGHRQLVAYVVAKNKITKYRHEKSIKTWKDHLKRKLPSYMVPSVFIIIPRIPSTSNGKVDRKMLPPPVIKSPLRRVVRPKTETEKTISSVIQKNTGLKKIGINDNFIELGIDSLIALMIIVDIEEEFDKRLPITVLVHHPTVKLLSTFINSISSSPYNSLLPLKAEGAKVPLYLIHGIGLNLFNFMGMVGHMDAEQPVYGLRAAGLDGNYKPLESIEEVAAYYNQEILNHDPIGPYAIAGYSYGGVIAYEMARQMMKAGKKVELLAMMDTNLQQEPKDRPLFNKIMRKFGRQYAKLLFRTGSFVKNPASNVGYIAGFYRQKLLQFMAKLGLLDKSKLSPLPEYMQKVVDKFEDARVKYVVKPFNTTIDIFRAQKRLYYIDDPEYLGWEKFARGGINVYDIPGDHKEMFYSPGDQVIAEILQKRLDEIPANQAKLSIQNIA